ESYKLILDIGSWIIGIISIMTFYGVAERFGQTNLATAYIILTILSLPWISPLVATVVSSTIGIFLTIYVALALVVIGYIALFVWNLKSIYQLSQSEAVV
ncbi:MAG TPA: hypothetical protein PKM84_02890, partial [Candidatus Pacearchaeota archaeon]|nr:hypothetical protein [Candidatus Pacearchaeota archaeon]